MMCSTDEEKYQQVWNVEAFRDAHQVEATPGLIRLQQVAHERKNALESLMDGAPNAKYHAQVTPASRGKRKTIHSADETDQTQAEKRASMTWAKRLKRVFDIDIA